MKSIKQITLASIIVFTTALSYAQQMTISVEITNIKSDEGNILIGLFDSEKNFLKSSLKGDKVKAKEGKIKVSFENIPTGTYTISVIHDENDNGELDSNFMGIPKEPYGISMDGKNMFGPPSYEKAKFELSDKVVNLTISL